LRRGGGLFAIQGGGQGKRNKAKRSGNGRLGKNRPGEKGNWRKGKGGNRKAPM